MKLKIQVFVLFLGLVWSTLDLEGSGLNDSLYFEVVSMKDGLPGSTIMDFEQDSLGFIWIATNDGLCRYDGTNFKVFKHDPNDENSLWNNAVQNLFLDQGGNLWIMTSLGLNHFDLKRQKLIRINANPQSGELLDNFPTDIVQSRDGTLFIGSYYSGINYRKKNKDNFEYLDDSSIPDAALSSTNINCLELLNDSLLFVGYRDAGIDIYDYKRNITQSLEELTGVKICSNNVQTLCPSKNNGLWIGTDAGLSHYNAITNEVLNFPYNAGFKSFVADREIMSLFSDDNGNLWIGTRRNGIVIVNEQSILLQGKNAEYTQYLPTQNPGSLSYRTVLKIFRDRSKQIWIGTHGGGVNLVESKHQRFGHIHRASYNNSGLTYNKVWGITEDQEGNIWIGTDGDGVNVWNMKDGVKQHYRHNPEDPGSLSDNAIISALTDSKGQIWLGTYEGGLNRFDKQSNKFIRYTAPEALPVNDVRSIYEDANNALFVGLNRGGVARYDQQSDSFEVLENTADYDVRSIFSTGDVLWLGTYSFGLIKYSIPDQSVESLDVMTKTTDIPPIKTIYSIFSKNGRVIWFGTGNFGLCRLDTHSGELKVFSEKNGLANNKIHAILPDDFGNLWLTTNKGISRFNIKDEVFFNFDWHKGVQPQEFHDGSKLISKEGLYYFGGINGLNYFNPKKFLVPKQKPNLQFTGFTVMNRTIRPGDDKIIDKSIEYRPEVNLNHEHSFFTIEFQSLNHPLIVGIQYDYQLEGYDTEWIKAGNKNIATYRNIPPGDYTFHVRCYQNNNTVEYNQISLGIKKAPPFWGTVWAYLIYFLAASIIALIIFRYRVKQFQYKNRIAYEKKLRMKQEKLHEERLDFFTNISHELRTPLTLIGIALEEMGGIKKIQPKLRKTYDTAVKNSDRLLELINNLLEFRRVEKDVASLSVEQIHLNSYLPEFLQDFRQLAQHNEVSLKLSLPLNDLSLWIDKDKFSMILNNLLSNAFKNTPSGGQITVGIDEDEQHILVKVIDSGIGIRKKDLKKIFNRYYKLENKSTNTGIGLALTKSLVQLHQGKIEAESTPNKGSIFSLKFLKGMKHFSIEQLKHSAEEENSTLRGQEWLSDDRIMLSENHQILLLIDDNTEILDLLHDKFVDQYKIIKAHSGEEGVLLAQKFSPDLIISDIMMPGISGIEVCQQLKNEATTSHIPIILLTAKGSEKDEIEGLNTGADDYISKPFKFAILKARVNTILENRKKIEGYFEHNNVHDNGTDPKRSDKELAFLIRLNDYVLANCLTENVSVFDIASDLGFSRTSLYRKVKSLTGLSINAFVRSVKIKKSAELIAGGMNVSEAAYSVGFEDLKYFRDSFKKQIGKNPSELK
jgi:signal transduction histidine kinase/ligand-binding sensor domain-containing protein/DNA-binding response OmpR family regulator